MPVDPAAVQVHCHTFIAEMASNRRKHDDAGVARRILEDLQRHGDITRRTRKRLLLWCHTNGNVFRRGAPIAQNICIALYGRVLPREEAR